MPINSFIQQDPSTPAVATGISTGVLTTASFSPPGQTLMLALVVGGWGGSAVSAAVSDSLSGSWTTAVTAQGTNADHGVAMIAYQYLTTAPGSMTVSATYTNLGGGRYLSVYVLNGASPVQTGGATATRLVTTATTDLTTSITTTQYLSAPFMVFDQSPSNTGTLTAGANTTLISAYSDATDTIEAASGIVSFATGNPGATTVGFTQSSATTGNLAVFEVLPARGPLQGEMAPPSTSVGFASNF